MFFILMGKGLRHKKNFLVARQMKVTRNCEISIIMENRINKCNISISTLLFFFSIYSSGTQELHPHEANWRNAYNFVIPIQNVLTLVISLALCAHKES